MNDARRLAAITLALAALPATLALAGPLPPTATPLTADEVTKLHAGNSGIYPTIDEYFAPDGTTIGVFGKPAVKSTFAGRWVVYGNTLCTLNGGKYDAKIYTDCSAFWHVGSAVLVLWSTHSDGSRPDAKNGYFDAAAGVKPGNLVADRYKAAGGT